MKWTRWDINVWVLEAEDGEVLDQVRKEELGGLYYVKSTGKNYTSEKAAKAAAEKGKKEQPK